MIKYTFLMVLFLLSISGNATSCLISDGSITQNSLVYEERININISSTKGLLNVQLTVPSEIDGMKLRGLILRKDKSENAPFEFAMPLSTFIEHDKVMTWYNIDEKLAHGNYLTIDYGGDCGISLKYLVN